MITFVRSAPTALLFFLMSSNAVAQSVPTSLFACVDGNGNLYGVTPSGKLGEGCSTGDLPVSLGSAGQVKTGNGLVGTISNGVIDIGVAPGLAVPPSCPPGQIPIADGQGAWICTLPNFTANPNPRSTVWVVPRWKPLFNGKNADLVSFVNPGAQPGRVICYTMTALGGFVRALTEEHVVSGGSRGNCDAFLESGVTLPRRVFDGTWLVIVSDVPILPSAARADEGRKTATTSQLEAYPIDCDYPEGYELVCDLAID